MTCYLCTMPQATIGDVEVRVVEGLVSVRQVGERRWRQPTRRELLALPADGEVWTWLRGHGVWRPSPSGTLTEDERDTVQVKLRLSAKDANRLRELAEREGVAVSAWVAKMVNKTTKGPPTP